MTTIEGDEEPQDLRSALDFSFQETLPEQFRTEDKGDYEVAESESDQYLSPSDREINAGEREAIARLNIELIPRSKICPYLKQTPDSESHYHCTADIGRCTIKALESLCLGNFGDCDKNTNSR